MSKTFRDHLVKVLTPHADKIGTTMNLSSVLGTSEMVESVVNGALLSGRLERGGAELIEEITGTFAANLLSTQEAFERMEKPRGNIVRQILDDSIDSGIFGVYARGDRIRKSGITRIEEDGSTSWIPRHQDETAYAMSHCMTSAMHDPAELDQAGTVNPSYNSVSRMLAIGKLARPTLVLSNFEKELEKIDPQVFIEKNPLNDSMSLVLHSTKQRGGGGAKLSDKPLISFTKLRRAGDILVSPPEQKQGHFVEELTEQSGHDRPADSIYGITSDWVRQSQAEQPAVSSVNPCYIPPEWVDTLRTLAYKVQELDVNKTRIHKDKVLDLAIDKALLLLKPYES
jgi:hypothetical protein